MMLIFIQIVEHIGFQMKKSQMIFGVAGLLFFIGLMGFAGGAKAGKKVKDAKAEDVYLLEFGAVWCPPCQRMKPLVERLEKEEKVRIEQYDVDTSTGSAKYEEWNKKANQHCAGIPFFVNKRTLNSICGATNYENLKSWALEKPKK